MNQEPRPSGTTFTEELNRLARQLTEAARLAWESEDRKRMQAEVEDGLRRFGDQVEKALQQAKESETTKQFSEQAQRVVTNVRETRIADEVRDGLISGLASLNRELSRMVDRLGERQAAGTQPQPPETEAPTAPHDTIPPSGPSDPVI